MSAPPFPLTLPAMSGMAPHRARTAALPASLFALLTLLCFPLAAQAVPPSYEDNPPQVPGEVKTADPKAKNSKAGGGGTATPGDRGSGSSGSDSRKGSSGDEGGGVGAGKGGGGDGKNQGSPGETGLGDQKTLAQAGSQGGIDANPASDDSGGSSPLAPILIAIAVLAAISIGVVLMRQRGRRGGDGGSDAVSTEAG